MLTMKSYRDYQPDYLVVFLYSTKMCSTQEFPALFFNKFAPAYKVWQRSYLDLTRSVLSVALHELYHSKMRDRMRGGIRID